MILERVEVRKSLVESVIAYACEQQSDSPERKRLIDLIAHYFANVPLEDLQARQVRDLYGAVYSHWKLLKQRQPGEVKITLFTPRLERDGWQSNHTIIELICDDMPFLVDSVLMEVDRQGYATHLVIHLGGVKVKRDSKGLVENFYHHLDSVQAHVPAEAPIYVEISHQTDVTKLQLLQQGIQKVLEDVHTVVDDWHKMRQKVIDAIEELEINSTALDSAEVDETRAFLHWLVHDHFTFLGYRSYELVVEKGEKALRIVPGSGLGVLRNESMSKFSRLFSQLPPEARALALSKQVLIISKTNTKATVHRPVYTDYIGVKRFNEKGEVIGERRFIGLFTSEAYHSNPRDIPFLRHKVSAILASSQFPKGGHGAKALANILESLPRDDLFQGTMQEIRAIAIGILHLQGRRWTRLFLRKDAYGRYMSCLVYMPRDNFNTELSNTIERILINAFHGTDVSFQIYFPESLLVCLHYVIRVDTHTPLEFNFTELQDEIIAAARSWKDECEELLLEHYGEEKGSQLALRYAKAFPAGYREAFTPMAALPDIAHIERLGADNSLEMRFYRLLQDTSGLIHLKLYRPSHTVPLSDALPILENMGLRVIGEQPYKISFVDGSCVWINDFNMESVGDTLVDVDRLKDIFQTAFRKIWFVEAENDAFNRLVLKAELTWREVSLLRAYSSYFRQAQFAFSQEYYAQTLLANPVITRLLITLFSIRFSPEHEEARAPEADLIIKHIESALNSVTSLDEDRILRRYLAIVKATLRTNYFIVDQQGQPLSYLSFKFRSAEVPELPLPLPKYEIYVYSPRFEGIHLRTADVARGGLRWSDRPQDYRTEVLGLVKAQQVKNAIIVPSGAKGGFVPKWLTADSTRETIMQEGQFCYRQFIRGLLDITDNLVAGAIVPPARVIRYDNDDPYLVVAADKGTATFSDIANGIAQEYQFWMGDAFASGGSAGYDHKKMGITARGAWVSVQQHFRELGIDADNHPISVVGIGDMSGDVFGNGLLMSKHLRLVAAFNHMHIFIDPNPDSARSFEERLRLFTLPRSTWEDYNAELISIGGGVYSRKLKSITLTPEVKQLLEVTSDQLTPNELIQAILKAPVDLLWNGGIGTYVKSTNEKHADVGDRANDALRINGNELRCKVVGEGGNLGFAQLGRIEYDRQGGRINTDFIDNSGGVDCSDHEVNIKILLNTVIAEGLLVPSERNKLLEEMTEEVAEQVLADNYRQALGISLASFMSQEYLMIYQGFIKAMEEAGKLNRDLEFLPSDKEFVLRNASKQGLHRPEIAVISAYSKIVLKEDILKSDLPEESFLSTYAHRAFPKICSQRFAKQLHHHPLYREIVATQLSNDIVNDMGVIFVHQMRNETDADVALIVRANIVARHIFNVPELWLAIDQLQGKISPETKMQFLTRITQSARRCTRWFLRNRRSGIDMVHTIECFKEPLARLRNSLDKLLTAEERARFKEESAHCTETGLPAELAIQIASIPYMYAALNIIETTISRNYDLLEVAHVYFSLGTLLQLGWFRDYVNMFPVDNTWALLARASYKGDLDMVQRALTMAVLDFPITAKKTVAAQLTGWSSAHASAIQRWLTVVEHLRTGAPADFALLAVAKQKLQELC